MIAAAVRMPGAAVGREGVQFAGVDVEGADDDEEADDRQLQDDHGRS